MRFFKKRLPLLAQLIITSIITVLAVVFLMFYQTIYMQTKIYRQELEIKASTLRNNISATRIFSNIRSLNLGAEGELPKDTEKELDSYLEQMYQYDEDLQYFVLYNKNRKVIYVYAPLYYYGGVAPSGRFAEIPSLDQRITVDAIKKRLYRPVLNNELTSFLFPLAGYGAQDDYLIEFGFSQLRAQEAQKQTVFMMTIITFIVIAAGIFLAAWRAVALVKPIKSLTALTEKFGKGDLKARAYVKGSRETVNLAKNFNFMAAQLQEYISELKTLYEQSRKLSSLSDKNMTLNKIVSIIKEASRADACFVYSYYEGAVKKEAAAGVYEKGFSADKIAECAEKSAVISGGSSEFSAVYIPLVTDDKILGALAIARIKEEFTENEKMFMETLANQAAVSYANAVLYEQTITDSLTGLYLRRYLEIRSKEEIDFSLKKSKTLSFLMIDIDNFKPVNDNYGHAAGDKILKNVAAALNKSVRHIDLKYADRKPDIPARYGGEEFSVLLPQTNLKEAVRVAERIRESIEDTQTLVDGQKLKVTVSVGAAELKENDNYESLVKRADGFLYEAKETGKNKVCFKENRL